MRRGPSSYFNALKIRKGHKKAIVALGHKLLRLIYAILSRHTTRTEPSIMKPSWSSAMHPAGSRC